MILYHFPTSPFSRRTRLALAHKGLAVELRDARASQDHLAEVRRLNPLHTVPVLVDGERTVADSNAICQYLERKVPEPSLWPAGLAGVAAFEVTALTDTIVTILADLGMRYSALRDHPRFADVKSEYVGRVGRALGRLAEHAAASGRSGFVAGDRWSLGDMALLSLVVWLEGIPGRAATFPPARTMLELGWSLPASLGTWADRHRARPDAVALG